MLLDGAVEDGTLLWLTLLDLAVTEDAGEAGTKDPREFRSATCSGTDSWDILCRLGITRPLIVWF